MIRFDDHEIAALAVDLPRLGFRVQGVMEKVFKQGAQDVEDAWRANAEQTSGTHGKHYPASIDHERLLGTDIAYEIGPNPAKRQGGMRFEDGGPNQPPHLDGQKAADEVVPRIERRVDSALGLLGL